LLKPSTATTATIARSRILPIKRMTLSRVHYHPAVQAGLDVMSLCALSTSHCGRPTSRRTPVGNIPVMIATNMP
jgi:hypothetical protein